MANLHINQFAAITVETGRLVPVPVFPPDAQQNIAFTTSTQSAAAVKDQVWQVIADADCYIEVGANPTATVNSTPLASGAALEFKLMAGHKLAVVAK